MMKKTVILIFAMVVAVAALIFVPEMLEKKKAQRLDSIVSLVVSNKEKIAELVTYRMVRDTLLTDTREKSYLSSLVSDSSRDTVAIYIVHAGISAGVDLSELVREDFKYSGDTLYLMIPAPKILDVSINVDDIIKVYSAYGWNYDESIAALTLRAKRSIQRSAARTDVLAKASSKAESSLSTFLSKVCCLPVVVSCESAALTLPDGISR